MRRLRNVHCGETATIVGLGPSVRGLAPCDFPTGPVITINHAILVVRQLGLPNTIYTMQKDGCMPHNKFLRMTHPPIPIRVCMCPSPRTIPPEPPEVLLLSEAESRSCFTHYPRRHVIDVERDFGLPWNTMSVPVATRLAALMGCTSILMLGHDAYTRGDNRRFDGRRVTPGTRGYHHAGFQAAAIAAGLGIPMEFR